MSNKPHPLEKILRLAEKTLRSAKGGDLLQEKLRALLRGQEEALLDQILDHLQQQEEESPHLLAWVIYQLMQAASLRTAKLDTEDGGRAVILVGLVPFCLQVDANQDPAQIAQTFLQEKLQKELARDTALRLGLLAPGDGLFFFPWMQRAEQWPVTWIEQYAMVEGVLEHLLLQGEKPFPFPPLEAKNPAETQTSGSQVVSLVLPFVLLAPTQPENPLLHLILKGPEEAPEELARWEILRESWDRGFLEIPGVQAVHSTTPGLIMETLTDLALLENRLRVSLVLETLRRSRPGVPIHVFAKAFDQNEPQPGEWRILLQAGQEMYGICWEWLDYWEETEAELTDLLLEEGVDPSAIWIADDVEERHALQYCPECGQPYFQHKEGLISLCGHPIPVSRSWQ